MGDSGCFLLNFIKFLDGGIINPNGSENKILDLKNYPTSLITAKKLNDYYYIFSPNNPVSQIEGFGVFNWDVEGQALISADFESNISTELTTLPPDRYPGDVLTSPENKYIAYPMTIQDTSSVSSGNNFIAKKFNPFLSDSHLVIRNTQSNQGKTILENSYNRQLFSSFSQFSTRGDYFYTITIENNNFKFIRVSLDPEEVRDFADVFPYFDWSKINWNEFFPRTNDFLYAYFSLSPDEERMIIYKNNYSADMKNPCSSEASHKLWILNLENGNLDIFEDQKGSVSDVSWEPHGSQKFAIAVDSRSGCYPDYLDAKIDIFDKNGNFQETIITEPKSKITNIGWSPDGEFIAYDLYSTDLIGKLNMVEVKTKTVKELINTRTIEGTVNMDNPVLILFTDWVGK